MKFHFPEPTELVPPLIQLMDVSFQYPGRDDFGLEVGVADDRPVHLDASVRGTYGRSVARAVRQRPRLMLSWRRPASSDAEVCAVSCHPWRDFAS